jgi:acetolactate decarboxylase
MKRILGMSPDLDANARRRRAVGLAALLSVATLAAPAAAAEPDDGCDTDYCAQDAIFQAVPLQALTEALLESPIRFATVLAHGDFGLGGLSPLDGEIIVLDGRAYHAALDGTLRTVAPEERTSVAMVKRFRADRTLTLPRVESLDALIAALDAGIAAPNRFHTVRIDARFERLRLRSVPRQTPPYRSVADVVRGQNTFELRDVEGTLVGFRFPGYLAGVNAGGYHFHFVDRARRRGGHLLDIAGSALPAQVDSTRALTLIVPDDSAFDRADFGRNADAQGAAFHRALRPDAAPSTDTGDAE